MISTRFLLQHGSVPAAVALLVAAVCLCPARAQEKVPRAEGVAGSAWVYPGPDGKLVYKTTPQGDRIMDFSHAGYKGGGVPLPDVPVRATVRPPADPAEDCTALIQGAIDRVSAMAPDAEGFRGAVLLEPGEYLCSAPLTISTGGVVLRGSGREPGFRGSTIRMTGGRHTAVVVGAPRGTEQPEAVFTTTITDKYVPAGTYAFSVADASGLAAGDVVELRRPVTEAWVRFMQMDDMTRDGKPQTWIRTGTYIPMTRRIASVDGNRVIVEVPFSDSFDARYLGEQGTEVARLRGSRWISQVGIEYLRIASPEQAVNHTQELYMAVRLSGEDCWMRDVRVEETMNSVSVGGHRITLQRVNVIRKAFHSGASKPAEFAPNAGQLLLDRCSVEGDNIWFAGTGAQVCGPIVLLNCDFTGDGHIEGHQRWSTGMLLDNCRLPGGGIDFKNRGSMGSGHGWGMGWAVAWNCVARTYVVQQPPGAYNWAIGCIGESTPAPRPFGSGPMLPVGVFDSPGIPVAPQSLYLAQLLERKGPSALEALGYASVGEAGPVVPPEVLPAPERTVDPVFGPDQGEFRPIGTSGVCDHTFAHVGERAVDGKADTYWRADGKMPAWAEMDTEGAVRINAVLLSEPPGLENIRRYRVEGFTDDRWQPLSEGTTVGRRKVDRFPPVTVWKVRVTVDRSEGAPALAAFGLYDAP